MPRRPSRPAQNAIRLLARGSNFRLDPPETCQGRNRRAQPPVVQRAALLEETAALIGRLREAFCRCSTRSAIGKPGRPWPAELQRSRRPSLLTDGAPAQVTPNASAPGSRAPANSPSWLEGQDLLDRLKGRSRAA